MDSTGFCSAFIGSISVSPSGGCLIFILLKFSVEDLTLLRGRCFQLGRGQMRPLRASSDAGGG